MNLENLLNNILTEPVENDVDYVFCVLDKPPSPSTPWPPISESQMFRLAKNPNDRAFYISTMLSRKDANGQYRNRQAAFAGLYMVVLDDVGTKVNPNNVMPTYIIETSESNYQYGYVLKEPIYDKKYAERFVSSIYETPLTDGGGAMVNKFVRLPVGINGKEQNGTRNTFLVTLEQYNDVFYDPEELLEAFGLELEANIDLTLDPTAESIELTKYDYQQVSDPLLKWLDDNKLVIGEREGWVDVVCPWHKGHTDGQVSAGYSPVGSGDMVEYRAFNCFHDHCAEKKTKEFLEWVKEQGGPMLPIFDPVAPLVSRYVLLEHSNEVADMWATAEAKYPIVSLASFRAAHKQYVRGERGGKEYYGELWLENKYTIRTKGRIFDPTQPALPEVDGIKYFNTYRKPQHPEATGEPTVYLDHIEHLIPNDFERDLYHNWIAQKLQKPETRSYALVMVAAIAEGEEGDVYGIGRSTVGDILGKVFQSGVVKIDLGDLSGKGDSQSTYNEWTDESMLCIVEETKDEIKSYVDANATYENLKKVVDIRPIPNVRVKPKYGRIYYTTLFTNFLLLTNHADALQIPEKDRRIACVTNNKYRRSFEEYAALHKFLQNRQDIANLFHWYMERDVIDFDHVYPPMTPAKQEMIRQGVTSLDEIWKEAIEGLEGSVVSKKQLTAAVTRVCDGDIKLQNQALAMVRARWRGLKEVQNKWRMQVDGQFHTVRIIRNHDQVLKAFEDKDIDWIRQEFMKNDSEQAKVLRAVS